MGFVELIRLVIVALPNGGLLAKAPEFREGVILAMLGVVVSWGALR